MNSNRDLAKILIAAAFVIVIGAFLCTIALGVGVVAVRMAATDRTPAAAIAPDNVREIAGADNLTPTPPPPPLQSIRTDIPENFEIFWEALELLQENFEGEMPVGNEITLAAVAGILHMSEVCDAAAAPTNPPIVYEASDLHAAAPANFAFFWESVNEVNALCGEQAPAPDALVFLALDGLIARLNDSHTAILPPDRAEEFRQELDSSLEGIGATVNDAQNGGVLIVRPFAGSPAERSGLRSFDVILSVDGVDVTDLTLDEAVRLIRGPAGSEVLLRIEREGVDEPFDVRVTRARIDIPLLETEILDGNLLHVALFDFSGRATNELTDVLRQAQADGVAGIILDLRGNPGGRLDVAIAIASLFIEDGVVVSESGHRNFDHRAEGQAIAADIPLAVLVDAGSASAAEIVAGAIQDYEAGALIGETTFGKGSVQSLFDLSDGSMLRVTTSHWFTPDGRQIEDVGLTPDIDVPQLFDTPEDEPLQAAIDYLQRVR